MIRKQLFALPRPGLNGTSFTSRILFSQSRAIGTRSMALNKSGPTSNNPIRPSAPSTPKVEEPEKDASKTNKKKSNFPSVFVLGTALIAVGIYYQFRGEPKPPKESLESSVTDAKRDASTVAQNKDISVIFVLGGPGAGKGTQCANLVKDYGFVHLSAGDLLRLEQSREGSQYGSLIADCIKAGTIVPQEVTIKLLENAIADNKAQGKSRFLIDGFPRKMDQAITFEEQVAVSEFTLFFECPEAVMLKRLLKRGETSGRTDDNIESIKKRFKTFIDTSMPVVEYFDQQHKVVKLYCDQSPEKVYSDVKDALAKRGIQGVQA